MGKYCGNITIDEACKNNCKDVHDILQKYNVSKDDTEEILGAIREGFYQAQIINNFFIALTETIKAEYNVTDEDLVCMTLHSDENTEDFKEKIIQRRK